MNDKDKNSNQNKRGGGKSNDSANHKPAQRSGKPALSSASNETRKTEAVASAATTTQRASTTTHTVTENKSGGGGWLPPVALLFGLIGTAFSAYLWSKLNSLNEMTTSSLTQQQESTKTDIATVKTEVISALEEKTAAVDTSLAGFQTKLEENSTTLNSKLEESVSSMQATMESTTTSLRDETKSGNEEIATSTANAMQELTSNSESELNLVSTSFNTGIRSLREDLEGRLNENDTTVAGLTESLQTTHELASRGQRDWILAEVEYLLRTGHHRVKLAGDVKAGVLALESANDRLHTLGDIDYFPVREQIKKEVTELRRLGPPDIEGLIFRLETAGKVADTLPLREKPKVEGSDAETEEKKDAPKGFRKALMDKIAFSSAPSDPSAPKSKKRNKPTRNQLTASEALNTHLQAARLSALRADAERFGMHMDNATKYADSMFDTEQDSVKEFLVNLDELKATNIVPSIPILGSALSVFEKIDAKRGKN